MKMPMYPIKMLLCAFGLLGALNLQGQEKLSARITVEYVKVMQQHSFLKLSAIYRGESGFEPCKNLTFNIYKVIEDTSTEEVSELKLGSANTNENGNTTFTLPQKYISNENEFLVKIENSEVYEEGEESISVTDALLEASIVTIDSLHTINAQLLSATNEPIPEQELLVGLKRLFGNLAVGDEDAYETDDEGAIAVALTEPYSGVDGKLLFEISLKDSDVFGTIIAPVIADMGVPIVDTSTFDQRTMWSPPNKTPLFLWIVPNIILIGIWSVLVVLVLNLFKIFKS
ncbi:hypothetical protein U1E44_10615 [Arenibacter sp. GZD96]|uniref:hypothetical protein n=1 Tax=Aurantibrevibacter litoralis TaxID=3106030 RepID=UPI002AFE2961|nr:hypothetical protein [Arenibacter sp. GZD-96]MEA1786544.1 hypothetical protein [Arenibacter sp. GZD-96]